MKYWLLAWALCAAPVLAAGPDALPAEAAGPLREPPTPVRLGYAFEDGDILLRQRIFGLAHGVHLLLSACLDKNENAEQAQQAYDAWHAAQGPAIEAARLALAGHHFGPQADRTRWQDVARVLGLKETIYPALRAVSLREACATLPLALAQPTYDFARQLGILPGNPDEPASQ